MQTMLLGMDDNLARFLQPAIEDNTNQLQVLNSTVSIMHDLSAGLSKYHPDILLLASDHMVFDTDNHDTELVNTLYQITQDPNLSTIRLAVITDGNTNKDTLSRLAVFVRDIFLTEPGTGRLDLLKMTEQLARPANVQNVGQYITNQVPPKININQNVPPQYTASTPPLKQVPDYQQTQDNNEVDNLKKYVELLKAQLSMQKRQNQGDFVPKEDYDNLLAQARSILENGSDDQQIKNLFQQVINSNTNYSGKLHEANDMISKQNKLIGEMTEKLKNIESHRGSTSEVNNIKEQLGDAQREVNNNNSANRPDFRQYNSRNSRDTYSHNSRPQRPPRPPRPNQSGQRRSYGNGRSNPRNTKLPAPTNRPVPKKKNSVLSRLLANKTLLIGIIGGVLLLLLLVVVLLNKPTEDTSNTGVTSTQSSSNTPSFNTFIKKGRYSDAAQAYPNRAVEAENAMLEDPDVTDKETFTSDILKTSDKPPIKFDNYYFEEKYGKCVDLLESSNDKDLKNLSDARRVMAAYAYMKDNKISKAERTAKPLKNKTLNERIKVYKQFLDTNNKLQAKIDSGSLSSSEEKKAKATIKDNKEKMKKL